VYLLPGHYLITMHGESVSASFFAPHDRNVEPFIRIATGDFPSLQRHHGRDNALGAFIVSMSHELIHYWQWVETGETSEAGVGKKAVAMMRQYAQSVGRP